MGLLKTACLIISGIFICLVHILGGSSYAISKIADALYLELSGILFISLLLANVYGPRNLSGPFPAFFQSLNNEIPSKVVDKKRDFIHIKDVINCIFSAINKLHVNNYFNVATGKYHSILSIFLKNVKAMYLSEKLMGNLDLTKRGDNNTIKILLDPSETESFFGWFPANRT